MVLFNQANNKYASKGCSPAEELEQLCLHLRMGNDQPRHLSSEDRELIGNLFFFTNVAIVVQWLRLLEHSSPEDRGAAQLRADFEKLIFSHVSGKQRALAVEHMRSLIQLTIELQAIVDDKSMSKEELSRRMLGWCRKWLGAASPDPNFVYRVGIVDDLTLLTLVHRSIGTLGAEVQAILSGTQS